MSLFYALQHVSVSGSKKHGRRRWLDVDTWKFQVSTASQRPNPPIFLVFFEFLTPLPLPPGADGPHKGRGHVGKHCPYTNNIWYGSVHALRKYRLKTTKMQIFPIDSHSNENFISPLFHPPGAANPQKGRWHIQSQSTPACKKIGVNRPAGCREIVDKKANKKNKQTVKQIPRPSL